MRRTPIQLPDPLYHRLKRIAEEQRCSFAEVIRRAGELYAQRFPENTMPTDKWELPPPVDLGKPKINIKSMRMEADAYEEKMKQSFFQPTGTSALPGNSSIVPAGASVGTKIDKSSSA